MSLSYRDLFAICSPDGTTIAAPSQLGHVRLVDAESKLERVRMIGHAASVISASFSVDDGSKLATGSNDGTCMVWDSSTGALLRTIQPGRRISSVAWGRDWERDWERDRQRGEAFAMGHHPRLGAGSWVTELEVGLVRMILDRV